LHRDDLRLRTEQRSHRVEHPADLMRLQGDDHAVHNADRVAAIGCGWANVKFTALAQHSDAVLLHGTQMRPRATSVTSAPAFASDAPTYAPIAPAPMTAKRTCLTPRLVLIARRTQQRADR
jgi:hypothetical protein